MVEFSRNDTIKVEGTYDYTQLGNPVVVVFEGEEEATVFAQAAFWLKQHNHLTVLGVAFHYIYEEDSVQLTLTTE